MGFGKKSTKQAQQDAEIASIKRRYAVEREYIREANRRAGNPMPADVDPLNDNDMAR